MRLHEDKEVFAELIENAAEIIGLPQVYVEKDYWVTHALKRLSESECAEQAIFKGGTSLSKAYMRWSWWVLPWLVRRNVPTLQWAGNNASK